MSRRSTSRLHYSPAGTETTKARPKSLHVSAWRIEEIILTNATERSISRLVAGSAEHSQSDLIIRLILEQSGLGNS